MGLTLPEVLPYILGQKVDNSSVQNSVVIVNSVFLTLVLITAGLRFWVRYGMLRSGGLDDLFMIIALISACLLSTSTLIGEDFGLGKHIWNLSPGNPSNIPPAVARVTKSLYGCYLAYSTAITFTKFSIIATYFRVFAPGTLRKVVLVCGVLVLGLWISSIFAIIFTCVPVSSAWDYSVKGYCYPVVNFFYASSGIHIFTDILLCALPIPTLWALSMPKPQRVILCCLFCGGAFACVASVLRLTHLNQLDSVDVSYQTVSSLNWSIIEVDTGIICSSVSALRALGRHLLPNYFPQLPSTRKNTSYPLISPSSNNTSTPNTPSQLSEVTIETLKDSASSQNPNIPQRSNSITPSRNEIYVMKEFDIQTYHSLPSVSVPKSFLNHDRQPC